MSNRLSYRCILLSLVHLAASFEIILYQHDFNEIILHWNLDYASKAVIFTISLPATDLFNRNFGFGFSDNGLINNADIVIISADKREVVLSDCWSDNSGYLFSDLQQDYTLISSQMQGHIISISFKRSFVTCDSHDYQLDNGTTNLISVIGLERDHINSSSKLNLNAFKKNSVRAQILRPLLPPLNQENSKWFDIVAPNVTIPRQETTYWCSVHQLPAFDTKVHGTGFDRVFSKMSKHLVHHIEVFGCDVQDGDIPYFNGECDALNRPAQLDRCSHVLAAWAFGAKAFFYPNEAGLSFYSSTKSRFVRLEIHYNNQYQRERVVDSSGIRFYYSNKLRKNEIGILETGVIYSPNMAIPPEQSKFVWTGFCHPECTKTALPVGGINVFASELHTHLIGRKVWTSHSSKNTVLKELNRDNHYSTWFEDIRYIYPPVKVMPGDILATSCEFNSKLRKNVTLGGLGIHEEMCVNYLHYYPATDLEVCKSAISRTSLMEFFVLLKMMNKKENVFSVGSMVQEYKDIEWNKRNVLQLESLYRQAALDVHCMKPNRKQFKGNWYNIWQPSISQASNENKSDCTNSNS